MFNSIHRFSGNIYSQNGEDLILREVLRRIQASGVDVAKWVAVEFGGADGYYCSNTAALRDMGMKVHMYDLQAHPPHVEERRITVENINDIPACHILSIDTDGEDYKLWEACERNPSIVIIEINSSLPPDVDYYDPQHGANFSIMNSLAEEKGYFLLCHTGNCIYIKNGFKNLFPDRDATFNTSWLKKEGGI